jgi:uncharacterized membrane protein YqjE
MVQLLWFQTLCAVSHPAFLVVGILALVAWAFNDVPALPRPPVAALAVYPALRGV